MWFFEFFGILCFIVFVICAIGILFYLVKEMIHKAKVKYQRKHRFDGPPTNRCYCIDCILHDNETGRCYGHELASGYYNTADNWSCWKALPREPI